MDSFAHDTRASEIGQEFAGLPMPRKLDILTDRARRPLEMSGHKRFPFPVPNGWFIVARGRRVAPGEVMPLYCSPATWCCSAPRTVRRALMDAHCPHLGAHLGVGGRVRGDTIQCPFHGWRFQGDTGTCVEVPYDEVDFIPRKAHARAYPTIERNQMIWAWHHLEGGEPVLRRAGGAGIGDPEWSDIVVREFPVATCCQEMAENNVDTVAFQVRPRQRGGSRGGVRHRRRLQAVRRTRAATSYARGSASASVCCG